LIFTETELARAYLIDLEPLADERGFFARAFCEKEFCDKGLNPRLVQCNVSFNLRKGTWRGMHYQEVPFEEAKLVRCTRGAIWDVIVTSGGIRRLSSANSLWSCLPTTGECSIFLSASPMAFRL
jgi:dTDP-4-dehydrorhamnose 3,5-epimerase